MKKIFISIIICLTITITSYSQRKYFIVEKPHLIISYGDIGYDESSHYYALHLKREFTMKDSIALTSIHGITKCFRNDKYSFQFKTGLCFKEEEVLPKVVKCFSID